MGIKISAPALLVLLLSVVALALMTKVAQEINVFVIAFPIKNSYRVFCTYSVDAVCNQYNEIVYASFRKRHDILIINYVRLERWDLVPTQKKLNNLPKKRMGTARSKEILHLVPTLIMRFSYWLA